MAETIEIDDELVKAAQEASGETDQRAAIETILRRALGKASPLQSMFELAGKVTFFDGYDPEAEFCGARPPLTEEEKKQW